MSTTDRGGIRGHGARTACVVEWDACAARVLGAIDNCIVLPGVVLDEGLSHYEMRVTKEANLKASLGT